MFHRRITVLLMLIALVVANLMLWDFAPRLAQASSAGTGAGASVVTFSRDVAPILFNKCTACHRPGEAAPMSLLTYKDARPWAKSIKEKVLNRTMPPWHADSSYATFANDRSLSKKDIDTIVDWVDGGAREGDPKELPPAPHFVEGWKIGKPDAVLTMPVKFDVPAEGVLDYKYFVVPTHFTEDRWVQAAEIRAGNRAVVHHAIVLVQRPGGNAKKGQTGARDDRDPGLESIAGLAPGQDPMMLPDGVGVLIRAGSVLVFQMHYTPNGAPQSDRTSIGFIFNKKPVVRATMGGAAINTDFAIPPGDPNYEVKSSYAIDDDCHVTSLMPHMHVRGKDFQYRLAYPDGASRIILSVPRYDFNWQTRYEFAEPVAAPKGSRIDCIAHFDNSSRNKANPDQTKLVRWGPQTWDEMMIGFVEFTLDHPKPQKTQQPPPGQGGQQPPGVKPPETKALAGLPAIEQILDKYVQAIGGRAAVQAQTSRVVKGTLRVPAFGADGTIAIYAKAPNKELTEIASSMFGTSRTGFDGTTAWEDEDGEIKDLTAYPRRNSDFYLPIKLQELFPRIELNGKEKIGNREAYRLEAPRRGNPQRWYFDTETGLLLRTEVRTSEGELVRLEDYDDYRVVDGVKIAFTIRQIDEDGTEILIKLSEVKHNVPINDAKFEKPAAKSPDQAAAPAQPSAAAAPRSSAILSAAEQKATAELKAETIRDVTTILSSKQMEGRGIAQPGGERAAKYLAERFAKMGLKPGGDASTYYQQVKFKIETVLPESSFKVAETAFKFRTDFVFVPPLPSETKDVSARLVFVGYGVVSDELKRDDLAGIDVKGKIVIVLKGKPNNVDAAAWDKAANEDVVFKRLSGKGAVGFVVTYEGRPTLPFSLAAEHLSRRLVSLADAPRRPFKVPPVVLISDSTTQKLLATEGRAFAQVKQMAAAGEFVSRDLNLQATISPRVKREEGAGSNVIGVIEGSDVKLKNEALVYTAHYDAFGIRYDGTIYPGAADNALGVGKLVAMAEVFVRMTPMPRRSIVFISPTGEEYGDLGSEYWLQHPTWPLDRVAANITYDGIGTDVWGKLEFILDLNFKDSNLNEVVKEVGTAFGVEIVPDTTGEEVFYRSDHYSFIKRGIPALFLIGGPGEDISQRAEQFLTTHYHMSTDIVQPDWNWEGARMLAALGLITGMRIANQEAMPAWKTNSPYKRSRGLHQ